MPNAPPDDLPRSIKVMKGNKLKSYKYQIENMNAHNKDINGLIIP